jgi:hypothetical protein
MFITTVETLDSIVFVGSTAGLSVSTDRGTSWYFSNSGLPTRRNPFLFYSPEVDALVVCGSYLFAGIRGGGLWYLPLSEVTSIDILNTEIPMNYTLSQNYPNPFNPSTTISFTLPSRSFVAFKIFDLLGREVATIVSEALSAGTYTRRWNADGLSSGVYFYRLQAGTFIETKKLVLLR